MRFPRLDPRTWTAFVRDVRAAFEADEPLFCECDDGAASDGGLGSLST